ncbi:MAG TPA: RIP metalloprotease RseP [Candidatus Methylomirabilis sp.]|nr:RIP metalloprotease RseP [Candidatus Methylomirabilis sp.]
MTTIVAFVVVLGVLILVHEFGHFLVARLSGVGVERFSVGFGPVLWRYRGPQTEYCLSAFPLGGYVKMMGDDENPLEGGKSGEVDPARAFNNKPLPVRFLIVFAGPAMNAVLAVVIFALVFMLLGRPVVPAVVGRLTEGGPAIKAGFVTGDRIVAVAGRPVRYWEELLQAVQDQHGGTVQLTVKNERGERTLDVTPLRTSVRDLFGDERDVWDLGARPFTAPTIGEVLSGLPAERAGLRPGDTVVAIDGRPVHTWDEVAETIRQRAGQPTPLTIKRGTETLTVSVVPNAFTERSPDGKTTEVGRIGISPTAPTTYVRSSPTVAIWDGVARTAEVTELTAIGLYKIVRGQLERSNIGGPIQIAVTAGEQARQGLPSLAVFTAVISVNLFLLNLLPVPMLDGGHLLFFACEAVLGRPLSLRKREVAQQIGFVLLMLLMVYAVYNDLDRIGLFRMFR